MSDLARSILAKIHKDHVKPTPRWVFLLKRSVIWGLFVLSVLVGSLAVSLVIFQVGDADWDSFHRAGRGLLEFALLALPAFWLVLMVGFVFLAFYNFRHTEGGYRYGVFAIVGLSLLVSLALGSLFYLGGLAERAENHLVRIPQYERLNFGKRMMWQRPGEGFLAGTVMEIDEDQVLILQDLGQKKWWVGSKGATIRPLNLIQPGARIKALGEQKGPDRFEAQEITPWRMGRMGRMRPDPLSGLQGEASIAERN